MAESISWSLEVDVAGGPSISASPKKVVEGYDLTAVEAEAAAGGTAGTATGGVIPASSTADMLVITATRYDDTDLTYDLGTATDVALDAPQFFTRSQALLAFGADPDVITVNNNLDTPVTVTVLTGRSS